MINGSCLCGKVKYQISGKLGDIVHCHCQSCRKAHAAAFSSVASVLDSDFQLMSETPLSQFESSPGKHRYFLSQLRYTNLRQKSSYRAYYFTLGLIR